MPSFDLHSHSTFSDGLLTPTELIALAAKNSVTHLALTDHDEVAGISELKQAARVHLEKTGNAIRVISGIECSSVWKTHTIHVVGLFIDETCPALLNTLSSVKEDRKERAVKIAARLAELGIPGAFAGARAFANNDELISRAHFGRFLVADGRVRTSQLAFDRYLGRGKLAYISPPWRPLPEIVALIHGAGGVAVLAHPARYRLHIAELRALIEIFKEAGGNAIEIISPSHSGEDVRRFTELARFFELAASVGSDFHGDDDARFDLGRCPPLPAGVTPVWSLRPSEI